MSELPPIDAGTEHPLIGKVGDGTDGIYVGRLAKVRDTVHELGLVEYEKNPFGNPYHVGPLTRGEAIANFRSWLLQKVGAQPEKWIPLLAALKGERLICHCAPLPCHAEVLVKASEWAFEEIGGVE